MRPELLRWIAIGLLVVAAVASGFAGDAGGPMLALSFAAFVAAVAFLHRWRRALRSRVSDREEKTGG